MSTSGDSHEAAMAAALVFGDDLDSVTAAAVESGPEFARMVSQLAGDLILTRALARPVVAPEECDWARCQLGFVRFSAVEGADGAALAQGFLGAAVRQSAQGPPEVDPKVALWLAETVPQSVRDVLLPENRWQRGGYETTALDTAFFRATGPVGVRWFVEFLRFDAAGDPAGGVHWGSTFQSMQVGRLVPRWPDEDWAARFEAVAESELPIPAFMDYLVVGEPPPRIAAPALARLVTTRCGDLTDPHFQQLLSFFRHWRTGEPARDADLFWWPRDPAHAPAVRNLLQLSGSENAAAATLDAAEASGALGADQRHLLEQPAARAAWADDEATWKIEPVTEVHTIELPDGRLAVGDPTEFQPDEPAVEVEVPPGTYSVRVIRAVHPIYGRSNVAAETVIDPRADPLKWQTAQGPFGGAFTVSFGLAVIGAPEFSAGTGGVLEVEDFDYDDPAAVLPISREPDGGGVACAVGPQHHSVQSWVGRDNQGRVARVISEFGILEDLDPTVQPPPW